MPNATLLRRTSRRRRNPRAYLEALESRTLMSATWANLDSFQLAPSQNASAATIATDAQGNLYATGWANDSTGATHAIVREQFAGSSAWTTIFDTTIASSFTGITFDAQGHLFVCGDKPSSAVVFERNDAGSFTLVDQIAGPADHYTGIAADATGNVFVVGQHGTSTTTQTKQGNNITTTTTVNYNWVVREWTPSTGTFTTVDLYHPYSGTQVAQGVTVVGNSVYVIGGSDAPTSTGSAFRWTVRRSSDAGHTWSTVDSFMYDSNGAMGSVPSGVAADSAGNLYVVGQGQTSIATTVHGKTQYYSPGNYHWIVRESASGNLGTWHTTDDQTFSTAASDSGYLNIARHIAIDSAGHAYVLGNYYSRTDSTTHYVIRTNASGSWTTFDDSTSAYSTGAMFIDASGSLIVSGGSIDSVTGKSTWLVRSTPLTTTAPLASPTLQTVPRSITSQPASQPLSTTPLSIIRSSATSDRLHLTLDDRLNFFSN